MFFNGFIKVKCMCYFFYFIISSLKLQNRDISFLKIKWIWIGCFNRLCKQAFPFVRCHVKPSKVPRVIKNSVLLTTSICAQEKMLWEVIKWSVKQGCHLSRIIRETPDFEPFLSVSRLESEIFRVIAEVCQSCRFCVVWAILLLTSNVSSQTPVCHCNISNNVIGGK